jgi:replicative DNA helicase
MVIVDYLQLIETIGGSVRHRFEQVNDISRGIKRMAREFNLPVIALAQIRRETEREDRPPKLSDLRDSGSIEQDADVVLFPWKRPETHPQPDISGVDLIIAKQRNGPLGKIQMKFIKRFAKFEEEA